MLGPDIFRMDDPRVVRERARLDTNFEHCDRPLDFIERIGRKKQIDAIRRLPILEPLRKLRAKKDTPLPALLPFVRY